MDWGDPLFVLSIIALSYLAWVVTTWIRAKHGYPIENEWGGTMEAGGQTKALEQKVAQVTDEVEDYRDRVRVLERIVTDRGQNLAEEIERLRDDRDPAAKKEIR